MTSQNNNFSVHSNYEQNEYQQEYLFDIEKYQITTCFFCEEAAFHEVAFGWVCSECNYYLEQFTADEAKLDAIADRKHSDYNKDLLFAHCDSDCGYCGYCSLVWLGSPLEDK